MELGIGIPLAAIIVFVALFFGWRQRYTLSQLRLEPQQYSAEDRTYYIKQMRRRLICSVLLLVFAGMLVGWFFLDRDVAALNPAEGQPLTEEDKASVRFLTWYVIIALAVLMAILYLASVDFLATARFGLRRMRELEHDRRAALEMEVTKLRRRRQEMN